MRERRTAAGEAESNVQSSDKGKIEKIWVQLGCNKTSRGLLKAPRVAIGAAKLQLVTSKTLPVTAEAAGSSPVVPAIHSQELTETASFSRGHKKAQNRYRK